MKGYLKRLAAVILTVSMFICMAASVDTSAFAAESTPIVSGDSGVPETTEQPATEQPTVQPATEQPTVQPATQAPTKPEEPAPSVGKVNNIAKTSSNTDSIVLKWDKTSGATGYVIYYCNADKTTSYTKLAYIKTNECTIKNLSHTTAYYFKIAAYVEKNGKKYEGAATLKKTATQPATPTPSLRRSSNVLEFSWTKNPKATGYKIYRASGSTNGKYVLYKTITNNATTLFSDTNVEKGRAYYYRVITYRTLFASKVNYYSKNGDIKFICGMCAPNYSMTTQLSRVSLTWKKNKYATGYDIYYATSKNGPFNKLGTTKNDYFNTPRLSNNKTYWFRVQPYKLNGSNKTKVVGTYSTKSKTVTNKAYGKTIGKTYIEISIKQQRMWYYINGDLYCQSAVVTGNDDGYHNTPKGAFKIYQRQSPATLVGADYVTPVKYWLAFCGGCGIHDSSWRASREYGGNTYKGNGSHGCVNTPTSEVKKFYQKARIGTYVVVY